MSAHAREARRTQVEIGRLAHLLGCEADRFAYLGRLSPDDVVALREATAVALHDADDVPLRRIAAAARLLPGALTAAIAQRAFGPLLSARLAALLDADRAVDVAGRLSPPFLADVAGELDPRRAPALVARLSPQLIAAVTEELTARRDFYSMGRFVGALGPEAMDAAVGTLDDRALLAVAIVLQDPRQLPRLVARLAPARLRGVLTGAADQGLWADTLDLGRHLRAPQRRRIAAAACELDDDRLRGLIDAVVAEELWDRLWLIAATDARLRARIAAGVAAMPATRHRAVVDSARRGGMAGRLGIAGVQE